MSSNDGASSAFPPALPATVAQVLAEGISLVLSRWTALQMAVENEWGGRDSRVRAHELADSITRWFSHPKEALYIDDLENMLDETMVLSFNSEIEDGSVEEVAEQLMILHEECHQGKFDLITKLRESAPTRTAVSQSREIIGEDEDEVSDEDAMEMMVDEAKVEATSMPLKQRNLPDEDGWSVVESRKGRGKR